MKRTLLVTFIIVSSATLAFAQAGYICLFSDNLGTDCSLWDNAPGVLCQYHVVYINHGPATAVQFAAPAPPCLQATYLNDTPKFTVTLGNSQDGVAIGFGGCPSAPVHVLTINFWGDGLTGPCCDYPVIPHPLSFSGLIEATDCYFQTMFPTGGTAVVNPDGNCPCDPTPSACDVTPTDLYFGTVTVGGSSQATFRITNTGSGTLSGTVTESCDHYSIESDPSYDLGPGAWKDFTVQFLPAAAGTHNCTIQTGSAQCVDVDVTGVGEDAPPRFVVSPSSIDFGRVAVDSTRDTSFTVKNIGGGTVTGHVSEPCSLYSISFEGPFSLAAGESLVVDMSYAPETTGRHDCFVYTFPSTNRTC